MFFVVFRNRKRSGLDQATYDAEAIRMAQLARPQRSAAVAGRGRR